MARAGRSEDLGRHSAAVGAPSGAWALGRLPKTRGLQVLIDRREAARDARVSFVLSSTATRRTIGYLPCVDFVACGAAVAPFTSRRSVDGSRRKRERDSRLLPSRHRAAVSGRDSPGSGTRLSVVAALYERRAHAPSRSAPRAAA